MPEGAAAQVARNVPPRTLDGVAGARVSTHRFPTEDGLDLSLLRFLRTPSDDVVLIIHGLTASSDMFIMPEHVNLVRYLLDHGFTDVWTLDFRMSNRHPYNLPPYRFTMDDVALFDFPAALTKVREAVGQRRIHVICHCLGSLSFMMSLAAGVVDGVASVVSNAVALTPRIRTWSRIKGTAGFFLFERLLRLPVADPLWGEAAGFSRGKVVAKAVSLLHRECDVPACHMLSFLWGAGWPAMYHHRNLHPTTHRRIGDLLGRTTFLYQGHTLRMVRSGNRAVKYDPENPDHDRLPDDYLAAAHEIETPVLFVTGADNRIFTDSNIRCFRHLEALVPGRHELHVFRGYGHADVFMGRNAHVDVFPRFLAFLEKQRARHGGTAAASA